MPLEAAVSISRRALWTTLAVALSFLDKDRLAAVLAVLRPRRTLRFLIPRLWETRAARSLDNDSSSCAIALQYSLSRRRVVNFYHRVYDLTLATVRTPRTPSSFKNSLLSCAVLVV